MKTCNDCKYGVVPKSACHLIECTLKQDQKTNLKTICLKIDPACSQFKPKENDNGTKK